LSVGNGKFYKSLEKQQVTNLRYTPYLCVCVEILDGNNTEFRACGFVVGLIK